MANMNIKEIQSKYVNREREKGREIGRYWSSEINSIKGGYLKPKDFFVKKPIDQKGVGMILTGIAMEDMQEKIWRTMKVDFKYGDEVKKEVKIGDEITLVVKPDFVFEKFILETKYPFSLFPLTTKGIPARYCYQLEAEYRAFNKPVYLGVFSIPFKLELIPFIPSEKRWNNIKKILTNFHQDLKALQDGNCQECGEPLNNAEGELCLKCKVGESNI